jgi:lipoprotein-releasing system permease protein
MSRLPFEFFLALRYLRPKRTFVSVITLISVIGVMLGVAVLIIVISVMSGFDQQLREKILGFSAHLKVLKAQGTLDRRAEVMRVVSSNQHVRAVAPFVLGQVLVRTEPIDGHNPMIGAPWVRGLDPLLETNVTVLPKSVVLGEFNLEHGSMLVGIDFARSLRLQVGDRVSVLAPSQALLERLKKQGKESDDMPMMTEFTVKGIFDVGYFEYNANVVVTSLEEAQDLYSLRNDVHGLLVMLDDPFKAEEIRRDLRLVLGPDYSITLWTEENSQILNALLVEKNVMFYLLFFIMIVAAFGIMNSQITFVVQKTREIGMLKALGATRGQMMALFLSQGLVVGVVGVVTGFGLGMLALSYRNEFLDFMNRLTGFELFPAQIYNFTRLPALIVPQDIAIICGSALFICLLAGAVPAWTAGRLRPVEALRHE